MNEPRQPATHLRDARLRQALEHAPDAQAAPAAAVREAILRHAHAAVAPSAATPAAAPWWQRLAGWPGMARRPWNAGFATVLVACVVAGLWWEREAPGPLPEADTRAVPPAHPAAPVPAPAAAPAATQAARAPDATDTARSVAQSRAPQAAPPSAPASPRPATPPAAPAEPAEPAHTAEAAPPSAAAPAGPREDAPAPSASITADAAAPGTAPVPSAAAARNPAGVQRRADIAGQGRPAAALVLPPAAAPRARNGAGNQEATRGAAPSSDGPAPAAPGSATAWTALQRLPATTPLLARGEVPADVAQAIDDMLGTGATAVPADDPVLLRITLLHDGRVPLGLLELGRYSLRWTPSGARTPRAFAARVEPALSLRVQEALGR